ncbi:hypothetical protein [Saccharopolyspora soli]|uniref:hypothetical protein n=1 Tax=Saccharopolyspora soli TaxID=2926618 RepID=UPI001F5750EB|nr:hypothetical protein [Saccharopolyspora soli]
MAQLAREVAEREIAETRWLPADRPAGCGFLLVEDGLGPVPVGRGGETATAQAVSWGPHPDGLMLTWWISRAAMEKICGRTRHHPPPLFGVGGVIVSVEDRYRPLTDLRLPIIRARAGMIQAMWLLMDMPGVASATPATPAPAARTAAAHRARDEVYEPVVTVIQIRRQQPVARGTGRSHFHHRWVVRPHKRWQACGPGHRNHRRILIAPHIKGPAGAPLLHRDHVTLWCR